MNGIIIETPNPDEVILQAVAENPDGTPKTSLTTSTVRVFYMSSGSEIEVLSSTSLIQVGSKNIWRYTWEPSSLVVGQYFAEYYLVDDDGAPWREIEGIVVKDFAEQTDLAALKSTVDTRLDVVLSTRSSHNAGDVWDVDVTSHDSGDKAGKHLLQMSKIESGRWKMVGNQFIIYDTDEVTPLLTFNLKDLAGDPSMTNVYERDPV